MMFLQADQILLQRHFTLNSLSNLVLAVLEKRLIFTFSLFFPWDIEHCFVALGELYSERDLLK